MNNYAPIVLFVYNRLSHTKRTLESLRNNQLAQYSDLYVFSDGPKNDASVSKVTAVRDFLKNIEGFRKVSVIERPKNMGLAASITSGVTEIIAKWDRVIVLEDDLVVSPYFLKYMNDGLALYKDDEQVASIHGYAFPMNTKMPKSYFLKGADCWGWATWKRAWARYQPDGEKLLSLLKSKKMLRQFDYEGIHKYSNMLKDQIKGKNNSWAIRWHASAFVENMLTLYPGKSLVFNIGMDSSGSHCPSTTLLDVEINREPVDLDKIIVQQQDSTYAAVKKYFKEIREPIVRKIFRRAARIFTS